MREFSIIGLSILVAGGLLKVVHAQDNRFDVSSANLENGRGVAVGANLSSPSSACFRCHGVDGQGDAAAVFPRLSSQPYTYLYDSLKDYASGLRNNPVMTPIARTLNDEQMKDVSAFYAKQSSTDHPSLFSPIDSHLLQRGAAIATVGNAKSAIQGCVNCHGPDGRGLVPSYPSLAGQSAKYIESQLNAWKSGLRKSERLPAVAMEYIAKQMTDEDIKAVASYYASIHASSGQERIPSDAIKPLRSPLQRSP